MYMTFRKLRNHIICINTRSKHQTQYLTLFDISARGYVRPVSISYVTKDPHKILPRFSIFMERFAKLSQILKLGYFPNFVRDLHSRLQDLEYTENRISSEEENVDIAQDNHSQNEDNFKNASKLEGNA